MLCVIAEQIESFMREERKTIILAQQDIYHAERTAAEECPSKKVVLEKGKEGWSAADYRCVP